MTTSVPIAFLLVKFQGSNDEPMTFAQAENMFTASGRGTMNVVDWFDDNTHGHVDMSGNEVFGWLELPETHDGYLKKRANNTYARTKIIELGRDAAANYNVDLSKFFGVVVVTNLEVDLFGTLGGTCCTAATTNKQYWEIQVAPSVLCQEMIHCLGVYNHARRLGSSPPDADYRDPYDVMSMFNAFAGHDLQKPGVPVGPGLNAAFMHRCGWLDLSRGAPIGQVTLRPLHRRDLPGALFAKVADYYVEYRTRDRWDTGFRENGVVLVHYIANNTSYLVAHLDIGDEFSWGTYPSLDPRVPDTLESYSEYGAIKVDAMDAIESHALITTCYVPATRGKLIGRSVESLFEAEFADGSGLVIAGGRITRIPPRSPELRIVDAAATLATLGKTKRSPAAITALRERISSALEDAGDAGEHNKEVSSPFDHITSKEAHRFHASRETTKGVEVAK